MALTAADWQQRVLDEVGAGLDGSDRAQRAALDELTPKIATVWDMEARWDGTALGVHLRFEITKAAAARFLLGKLRILTDASLGPLSPQMGQRVRNLQAILADCEEQIKDLRKQAAALRVGVSGRLTNTAPLGQDNGVLHQPDPNSRGYRGDAEVTS